MANLVFDVSTLNGSNGFILNGLGTSNQLGFSVSGAGDINGDGFDDLIIGVPGANSSRGRSYVVFGSSINFDPSFDFSTLDGSNGFSINGRVPSSISEYRDGVFTSRLFGFSVSSAGDINGDGFDDLIIGAPDSLASFYYDSTFNSGQSYVVFGSSNGFSPSLDLSTLNGSNGFAVNVGTFDSGKAYARSGFSVSSAGDINGDGFDDFILGAPGIEQSFVVFGKTSGFSPSLNVFDLDGSNGFVINGAGAAVSSAGDFNGDGIDDLIIGSPSTGQSYVVFGRTSGFSPSLNVFDLDGSNGFVINGAGAAVSSAGDFNGDGIDDLIIGSPSTGQSYVVFGRTSSLSPSLNLSNIDENEGFAINGAGFSVSSAGDFNDDGIDDLIIGSPSTGQSYVVFGRTSSLSPSLNLFDIDENEGFAINRAGFSVSSAGDVNGDGIDDLIIGEPSASSNGTNSGQSYVIFGFRADTNQLPVAVNDKATTIQNTAININVLGNDIDTDIDIDDNSLGLNIAINPSNGTVLVNNNGTPELTDDFIVYTPNSNFTGSDSFTYTIDNAQGSSSPARVEITVNAPSVVNLSSLNGSNGLVINGAGFSVSNAGDVNGDGIDDLIIGTYGSRSSYVIFGISEDFNSSLNVSSLNGDNGFSIFGTGSSVSSAGDINGDGIDDLIVGSFFYFRGSYSGTKSYVIFGTNEGFSSSLNISSLNGDNGFTINGIAGSSVSNAGDINGDGIGDIMIADPIAGAAVVFGSSDDFTPNLNISDLDGSKGFVIEGLKLGYNFLRSYISNAGDINGDGIDDIVIGAFLGEISYNNSYRTVWQGYVVFGNSSGFSANLNLSDLDGSNGFVVNVISTNDYLGLLVSNAGDVNGDGFDDIIIGAPGIEQSFVVFGKTSGFSPSLNVSDLDGSNGFVINGAGAAVSSAGDVNGDGIDDIIIGGGSEKSYVVFGKGRTFSFSIEVSDLDGSNGFAINGAGAAVSNAGDVNGDGIDDIIIGGSGGLDNGVYATEQSYVVFGNIAPSLDLNGSKEGIDFATTLIIGNSAIPVVANDLSITDFSLDSNGNRTPLNANTATFDRATITITNILDGANEFLSATSTGNIRASYNNGVLTLSGTDTIGNYQEVLRSLTYNNTAANPDTTARIIEFVVNDGQAHTSFSDVATTTLNFSQSSGVFISGNGSRDALIGTDGNDLIVGGTGSKTIMGGGGNDQFIYTSIRDVGHRITDFIVGSDKIVLTELLDSLVNGGYKGSDAIADGYVRLVVGSITNNTILEIDRDGLLGSAIFRPFLQLNNVIPEAMDNIDNFVF